MEGLNVLYTEVQQVLTTKGEFIENIIISAIVIGVIVTILFVIFEFFKTAIIIGAITVAILVGGHFIPIDGTEVQQNIYKVTIDATVNLKEFLDKYEIISQEGDIYTIKEKVEGVTSVYDSED